MSPVTPFEWGKQVGGVTPSGVPAAPAEASYGPPDEFSGSLAIGTTTITFTRSTKWTHILNTDPVNNFEVSFDGGTNWQEIASLGDIKEELQVSSILLRATVADVSYHVIAALSA